MATDRGYATDALFAFIVLHATQRVDGTFTHLNDIRLTESHRAMLKRWRELPVVPLEKVDRFLMKYDLMTTDLEDFAPDAYVVALAG